MANLKYLLATLFFSSCGVAALWPKEIHNYRWRYSVNVPANWLPQNGSDSHRQQAFRSPDGQIILQIQVWERREIKGLDEMYSSHLQQLNGVGVVSRYKHLNYEALLARIEHYSPQLAAAAAAKDAAPKSQTKLQPQATTPKPKQPDNREAPTKSQPPQRNASSYVLYFYGAQYAYRVQSSAPQNATKLQRDLQHSVLDSFGFEGHNYWHWGPLSSFFRWQKRQENPAPAKWQQWQLGKHKVQILPQAAAQQVAAQVLQREKRLLQAASPQLYAYALQRFYYMNFRQNYQLLKDFSVSLEDAYRRRAQQQQQQQQNTLPNYEYLLYDLQEFLHDHGYSPATDANVPLRLPSQVLAQRDAAAAGNIETLALIYVILASQLRHNSLLLYAPQYSQLLVGAEQTAVTPQQLVDKYRQNQRDFQTYNGISISWYKNRYLIGELSEQIYIGWARTPLRDLDKWIPLAFPRYQVPGFFP